MKNLEDEYKEEVKKRLDFDNWAGTTKSPEWGFCKNLFFPFKEYQGLSVEEKEDLAGASARIRQIRYIYSRPDAPTEDRFVIKTFECGSVSEAHEILAREVSTYMAPTLPKGDSLGLEIGDICFGNHGEMQTSLLFARYNILVETNSVGTHGLSVQEFAEKIDAFISSIPTVSEEQMGQPPMISEFSVLKKTLKIDEEILLRLEVSDPEDRELMLKVFGTGGTVLGKEDGIFYRAKNKGTQNIRLFVLNEDEVVSRAELEISVE